MQSVWDSDGFESGTDLATYFAATSGPISIDTTVAKAGSASLKVAGQVPWGRCQVVGSQVTEVTFSIRIDQLPNVGADLLTVDLSTPVRFGFDGTLVALGGTGRLGLNSGTKADFSECEGPPVDAGDWHDIWLRVDTSSNPWLCDWSVDGVACPQMQVAQEAELCAGVFFGNVTVFPVPVYAHYDNASISQDVVAPAAPLPPGCFWYYVGSLTPPENAVVLGGMVMTPEPVDALPEDAERGRFVSVLQDTDTGLRWAMLLCDQADWVDHVASMVPGSAAVVE